MSKRADRGSSWVVLTAALVLVLVVGVLWAVVFIDHGQGAGRAAQAGAASSSGASGRASSGDSSGSPSSNSGGSSSGSSSSPSDSGGWTMSQARAALADEDSRVLVLGDGTGDDAEEWVHEWARSREMPVAAWSTTSEDGYESQSSQTRMWSGSAPDAAAGYPIKHRKDIWPDEDPDLVLLSFGHAYESPGRAARGMEALRRDVAKRAPKAPIVVVLQNPRADDANAATRKAIASWAKGAGLPTIDVAAAFGDSELFPEDLRLDEYRPSPAGTEIWVETIEEALGG